jgi:antitoxin component HigA of HigAB toxin-antitoxin module
VAHDVVCVYVAHDVVCVYECQPVAAVSPFCGTVARIRGLSEILAGKRKLGIKYVRSLAEYFKIDPGLLIPG